MTFLRALDKAFAATGENKRSAEAAYNVLSDPGEVGALRRKGYRAG
jgi:hypothetical protein